MVREVFGVEPDPWQDELMMEVAAGTRRISVRSGHGVGKTTVLAWLLVWHILTKFPQKSVCTAPTSSQLFDALAAETFAWINKLPPLLKVLLEVKTDRIELLAAPDESFIAFKTSRPETPEALAGIHSENVLLIGDEASGIPEQVYEAAIGSMSGHTATTILAGNPVRSSGQFYKTHNDKDVAPKWRKFHVSCYDCSRVSADFIQQVADTYGERSNAFRVRVLGEFPLADDDTIIPFELVEASKLRDVQPLNVRPIWGLDVARFGQDRSALAKRKGNVLLEKVRKWDQLDTMELAGRVKAEWDATSPENRPEDICVDAIGIGAGVADRLREMGLPARAINVSESPSMKDRYRNLRAELWWKVREWFDKRDNNLAGDVTLGDELIAVKYKFVNNKLQVESKEEMKKRGLRSPDLADAFVLTFAVEAVSALHGGSLHTNWKTPLRRVIKGLV
jgi:phage terminase large subunit